MAADTPTSGDSSTGLSAAAAAAKLRDEAASAAELLEAQALSIRSSNAERSQQLQQEANLLKSAAAAAQERVRTAAAALDQEHAQADALEQQAATLRNRLRAELLKDDDDARSGHSEAAAIAHLHSQATVVQNIKHLIPIVLELQSSLNYSKWRGYFLLTLGRSP
jgi:small-conductance mechanosensitive channel